MPQARTPADRGFTLLEVLIAMSILVVGATSILSLFTAAVSYVERRHEEPKANELVEIAKRRAQDEFDAYRPAPGKSALPGALEADYRDGSGAAESSDPSVRDDAARFAGFRYEVSFEANPWGPGAARIQIAVWRPDGRKQTVTDFLTRRGVPMSEFYASPSIQQQKAQGQQGGGSAGRHR